MSGPATRIQPGRYGNAVVIPFVNLKAQYLSIREDIEDAIAEVLHSTQFVNGSWVEQFEEQFAAYLGVSHVVGVASGTAALELALKAAGIRPGDEVIVPANTFFATAEAVSNIGAVPVFADVNPRNFHMDVASAEAVLTPRTRAIIAVHLYGRAMEMGEVEQLAAQHRLTIIEDAAQAHGVTYGNVRVGASGRLTCFSFYPGKNLGAYGDAGAIACGQPEHAKALRLLRDHGSPRKYEHCMVGTNARLDSIQAAVLSAKLRHLDHWNALRIRHANFLSQGLARTKITCPEIPPDGEHNFHLFVVRSGHRDALSRFLQQRGIATAIHYPVPIHLTKAYQDLGHPGAGSLPVCEGLASEILSLPIHAELSRHQLDSLLAAVQEFCSTEEQMHSA
ncbi:MAG TPA: DegT/DnrJ/EryC1/StrS family aminotransferase [Candidatus Acidoferrum sp.]|nr:DegT/DnrJ/EryC1/StrS family aminotransferase [Candidatus Acidoferrum sp.]